jgi:hypothetical protein
MWDARQKRERTACVLFRVALYGEYTTTWEKSQGIGMKGSVKTAPTRWDSLRTRTVPLAFTREKTQLDKEVRGQK